MYDYIESCYNTLTSVSWKIRESCHCTLVFTPGKDVFGRYMLFNLTSIIHWRVITARKQGKVDIYNVHKRSKWVKNDQSIGDLVYVENTGIYLKLYYKKQGPYIITEVFINSTIWVQRGAINKLINIIRLVPHFNLVDPVLKRYRTAHIWRINFVIDTTPLQISSIFFFEYLDRRQNPTFYIFPFQERGALYHLLGLTLFLSPNLGVESKE